MRLLLMSAGLRARSRGSQTTRVRVSLSAFWILYFILCKTRIKIIPHEGCRGFVFIHEQFESCRKGKFTVWVRGSFLALRFIRFVL